MKAKKLLIGIGAFLLALILIIAGYLTYILVDYSRIPDNLYLEATQADTAAPTPTNMPLTLVTHNVGFGAYSSDYSFFMDGGEYSRAYSADEVIKNTNGTAEAIKAENPDFILLQEVDIDGTRSHHVNQSEQYAGIFDTYSHIFAVNYDSSYLFYPFHSPIGKNKSGIMTLSKFTIGESIRISLPVEDSLYKFLDLDRCYSKSYLPTDSGKTLVLYNVHLSAYTKDGTVADRQLELLLKDMETEYNNGNYCFAAGDFNKDMLIDSGKYFTREDGDFTWSQPIKTELFPSMITAHSGTNAPTCRDTAHPYYNDGTDFVVCLDGVLITDNITLNEIRTIDSNFAYSDHNGVFVEFVLN